MERIQPPQGEISRFFLGDDMFFFAVKQKLEISVKSSDLAVSHLIWKIVYLEAVRASECAEF